MKLTIVACALFLALAPAAQPPGFALQTLTDQIDDGCALAFAPDGRIFVAERITARIRVIEHGQLVAQPWAQLSAGPSYSSEGGFVGIAVHPRFVANGFVYANHVDFTGGWNQLITRLQEVAGAGANPTVLLSHPYTGRHCGGAIGFGKDGRLYVTHGEAALEMIAQSLGSTYGKILRVTESGLVPPDNPFVGVPGADEAIWSYGHRNPFGMCFHPATGEPWAIENGGGGGDEVNRIVRGGNYGWPFHDGPERLPDATTEDPVWAASPEPALCDGAFYAGRAFPAEYRNDLFVGDWKQGFLTRLDLDETGTTLHGASSFFRSVGPVFDVASGPDGALYILHSDTFHARGGQKVSRFVWTAAPVPAVHLSAQATRAIGGSITIGVVSAPGAQAAPWLAFREIAPPLPSPFGLFAVPPDLVLPAVSVGADGRGYLALAIPDDPALAGRTLYAQAATVVGTTITLAAATEFGF